MQIQLKAQLQFGRGSKAFHRRGCPKLMPLAQQLNTKQLHRWDQDFENNEFELDLAVALAGCAFESYLEPEVETSRKEVAVNRTETTYMDGEFVKNELLGQLEISDVQATNLPESTEVYAQISLTRSTVWTHFTRPDFKLFQSSSSFTWMGKAHEDLDQDDGQNSNSGQISPFILFLHKIPNQSEILKIRLFQVINVYWFFFQYNDTIPLDRKFLWVQNLGIFTIQLYVLVVSFQLPFERLMQQLSVALQRANGCMLYSQFCSVYDDDTWEG